ncbi:hypothetical protein DYB30_004227 [Aphanomyces astaci]|uniref:Uncharacterized protein n=1 Tax=Aphanomyces astaci TaxID=112090 RepID=A0A397D6T1_APHAT|nr:hypothetical protein DYB30_004227 [Aphanomyces astaci]
MEAATLVATPLVKNLDKIPGIHPNVDEGQADDDWEMPLLFMTHMPVNFIQNIDVAAMSTFSAEYNDDGSQDECEPRTSPPKAGKIQEKGNHRAQHIPFNPLKVMQGIFRRLTALGNVAL